MSKNPEVKLACNTELAFTKPHLIDLKPESCIALFSQWRRQKFLHARARLGTLNGARVTVVLRPRRTGHANPALISSNPSFDFQGLPLVQHTFFVGCAGIEFLTSDFLNR